MIRTYVCFLPDSLSPSDVADVVEMDLGFAPETIRTDRFGGSRGVEVTARSIERLRRLPGVSSVAVEGAGGSLGLTGIAGWPAQVVVLDTPTWPPEEVIDAASRLPGFSAALVGDAEDVFWQSADQINTYQVFGRPWEHLPTTHDEVFDRPKIDISANPGRQAPAPGMWLWAAAKMWFGPGSFALVDRDRLLDLPVGRVTARRDGIVVVELFDLAADVEVVRDAQRRFRAWLGYDALESRAADLAPELADPRMEVETGVFPHGGVRRITEWLDDGRLVRRSAAAERRTVELDGDGHLLWEETVVVSGD